MGRAMKGVEPLARDFFGVKPNRLALLCCFALFAPFAPAARFGLLRFQSRASVGPALQSHHSNGFLARGPRRPPHVGATLGQADGQLASLLQSFHASLMSRAIQ